MRVETNYVLHLTAEELEDLTAVLYSRTSGAPKYNEKQLENLALKAGKLWGQLPDEPSCC